MYGEYLLRFLLGSLQYTANGLASVTTPKTASSPIHLRASHDMPATSKLPLLNLDGPPPDISDPENVNSQSGSQRKNGSDAKRRNTHCLMLQTLDGQKLIG